MKKIKNLYKYFIDEFKREHKKTNYSMYRIGVELKFPLVRLDGSAVSYRKICTLWDYLQKYGWQPIYDSLTGKIVGVKKPGELNDTIASCETGFCKVEFSLAHVNNLFDLNDSIKKLREELRKFSVENNLYFLGYGIQPLTPPSNRLLMRKSRTSVWNKIFSSNRYIAKEDGDDIHLFTINAASHVHISVPVEEAILAVNVLNGFAGAQIALTANSSIWRGQIDSQYKCVAEKFWDWWLPNDKRVGIPYKPFENLEDYISTVFSFPPIYVVRNNNPILLTRYKTFEEYFISKDATGFDVNGQKVSLSPEKSDINLHNSFYWYDARISRYWTIENRVNDQQPPRDLICVAALTSGLISALSEAWDELSYYKWENLRATRECACQRAIKGNVANIRITEIAQKMLVLAEYGLQKRGLGEEKFLKPLKHRLQELKCPADEAEKLFKMGGIESLVYERSL